MNNQTLIILALLLLFFMKNKKENLATPTPAPSSPNWNCPQGWNC